MYGRTNDLFPSSRKPFSSENDTALIERISKDSNPMSKIPVLMQMTANNNSTKSQGDISNNIRDLAVTPASLTYNTAIKGAARHSRVASQRTKRAL